MTIPSSRHMPTSTGLTPVSREHTLDDTIEDSFPASDPPSTIPDPEPTGSYAAPVEPVAGSANTLLWAALAGAAVSALWLGLAWQRRGLR
jgi:hypothetical protein